MSLPRWIRNWNCRSCNRAELVKALEIAWEALNKMHSPTFNVGHDWNGVLKGQPDGVMCRNVSTEAMSRIERIGNE